MTKKQQPHGGIVNSYRLSSRAEIDETGCYRYNYRYNLLVMHVAAMQGCDLAVASPNMDVTPPRPPLVFSSQAAGAHGRLQNTLVHPQLCPLSQPMSLQGSDAFVGIQLQATAPQEDAYAQPLLPTAQAACGLFSGLITGNFLHLRLTNWLCALLCQEDGGPLGLWRQKSPLFEDVTSVIFLFSHCFKLR